MLDGKIDRSSRRKQSNTQLLSVAFVFSCSKKTWNPFAFGLEEPTFDTPLNQQRVDLGFVRRRFG